MKIVILITVIESSAVMLAILYFYYRRSQSEKRALVFRRPNVSITEQAQALSVYRRTRNGTTLSFREQTVKARTLNQKSRTDKALGSIHSPLKADIKI
jgi:hypothetical protein